MNRRFRHRRQAGQLLAERLSQQPWSQTGWVLALPRGGVPIGYEIAQQLQWPLDIWLVRKLGAPGQPELAIGAIATPDVQVLNQNLVSRLQVTPTELQTTVRQEIQELKRREQCYRQGRPPPELTGKPVILVDDGLATGATMRAAIAGVKRFQPDTITLALPIAVASSLAHLQPLVDTTTCLEASNAIGAISQWYDDFEPVSDAAVIELLDVGSAQ